MSGGGGQSTTQVQQIPEFESDLVQQNAQLATSLGSQAYPTYQGALIQGFSPLEVQGQGMAVNSADAYQPTLNTATNVTQGAVDPSGVNALTGATAGTVAEGLQTNATTPGAIQAYMNPYVGASLAPQIQDLNTQLGLQQRQIDAQATQSGAFGDARQGAASALQNYYGNEAMNSLVANGYNTAYGNAVSGLQAQQGAELQGANTLANLGSLQNSEQNTQIAGGQQLGTLAGLQQNLGLTGAGAIYTAGQQEQQLGQQDLNAAYQQYLNQVNWPFQMLNVRESALSNNPYNISTSLQLPNVNTTAQGFGALSGAAGLLGALGGSGGGSSVGAAPNVFGAAR